MTAETAAPVHEVLDTYCASWNSDDPHERRALLQQVLADGATYCDPTAHVQGVEGLVEHIGGSRAALGPYRIDRTSACDRHHDYVRFTWRLTSAGGEVLVDGFDVVELAADGRVQTIIGFFGPFPPD